MHNAASSTIDNISENGYPNGLRAFTFWIDETLYAVDIAKVLTISQELGSIQNVPAQTKGLLGMTEFQDHAIPVIDFASMLNLTSATESGNELIKLFTEREKDHHEWMNALENSITKGDPFLKQKDANQCAFGIWYKNFSSRDETLMEIMADFEEPHKRIHKLAEKLLNMCANGEKEKALQILRKERMTTMHKLTKLFAHAREHVRDSSRAVLLYITENGRTPTVALQIDDIHDVIDFKAEQFKSMQSLKKILSKDESKLINSYIKMDKLADCLLINASNIEEIISKNL